MITNTISLPELVWTIGTAIGTIFMARITHRAIIDLIALRIRRINSIREYAAITTLMAFATWTIVEASFFFVGISAMTVPNPRDHVPVQQYITLGVFLFTAGLLALAGYSIDKRRVYLSKVLEEVEEDWYERQQDSQT